MTTNTLADNGQMSMFADYTPTILDTAAAHAAILSQEFIDWLPHNLHVWNAFVAETMKVIKRGHTHYSSRTILEFLRHHTATTEQYSEWKINNNLQPYLARLFDAAYPELAGLFEYRTTTKDKGKSLPN